MLPVVTEIIFVKKSLPEAESEVGKPDLLSRLVESRATVAVNAKLLAVDEELVQMEIGPTKGNLKDIMEIGKGIIGANP